MKYSPQLRLLSFNILGTTLERSLNYNNNKWYRQAKSLSCANIELIYNKTLGNKSFGAGNKSTT